MSLPLQEEICRRFDCCHPLRLSSLAAYRNSCCDRIQTNPHNITTGTDRSAVGQVGVEFVDFLGVPRWSAVRVHAAEFGYRFV